MTRARMFGSDVEFCEWLRGNKNLPSYSRDCGFVASDTDLVIHRYLSLVDSIGTRNIQSMMLLEVKTRKGVPSTSQQDTLLKFDLFKGSRNLPNYTVRNFGVSVLSMSGVQPCDDMRWGRFVHGQLFWKSCDVALLESLLRFDVHPDSFEPKPFRRHHLTSEIVEAEITPLGFEVEKLIVKRS